MQISDEILKNRTRIGIMAKSGEVPHRAWIIMKSAELEALLGAAFLQWLVRANPKADVEQAKEDLIEKGALNSLPKIADLAFHAGIIGTKTRHDLRKFAKLRDRYAHDVHRKQLEDDPEMFKLLQETYLYKESRVALQALTHLPEQSAMLAISEQLKQFIVAEHVE